MIKLGEMSKISKFIIYKFILTYLSSFEVALSNFFFFNTLPLTKMGAATYTVNSTQNQLIAEDPQKPKKLIQLEPKRNSLKANKVFRIFVQSTFKKVITIVVCIYGNF